MRIGVVGLIYLVITLREVVSAVLAIVLWLPRREVAARAKRESGPKGERTRGKESRDG